MRGALTFLRYCIIICIMQLERGSMRHPCVACPSCAQHHWTFSSCFNQTCWNATCYTCGNEYTAGNYTEALALQAWIQMAVLKCHRICFTSQRGALVSFCAFECMFVSRIDSLESDSMASLLKGDRWKWCFTFFIWIGFKLHTLSLCHAQDVLSEKALM